MHIFAQWSKLAKELHVRYMGKKEALCVYHPASAEAVAAPQKNLGALPASCYLYR